MKQVKPTKSESVALAIVTTKKKAAETATIPFCNPSAPPAIVALIDRVGALRDDAEANAERIKALQADLKPYADMVKHLSELVSEYAVENEIDPDKEFSVTTGDFVVRVGKAGTLRTVVDVEQAMKKMGRKLFFRRCTIGLGVIDEYLTPDDKQRVLKVERCLRGIKVLHRAQGSGSA